MIRLSLREMRKWSYRERGVFTVNQYRKTEEILFYSESERKSLFKLKLPASSNPRWYTRGNVWCLFVIISLTTKLQWKKDQKRKSGSKDSCPKVLSIGIRTISRLDGASDPRLLFGMSSWPSSSIFVAHAFLGYTPLDNSGWQLKIQQILVEKFTNRKGTQLWIGNLEKSQTRDWSQLFVPLKQFLGKL